MIESWWPSDENSRDSIHQKHGIGSSFDQKKKSMELVKWKVKKHNP